MLTKIKLAIAKAKAWVAKHLGKVVQRFHRSTHPVKAVISTTSAVLSAGVSILIWPVWFGIFLCAMVFSHELGHFVAAHVLGGSADPPVFIPIGLGIIGITLVNKVPVANRRWVYGAGPALASLVAMLAMGVGLWLSWPVLVAAGGWALAYELYAITLGSDGRRYRRSMQIQKV